MLATLLAVGMCAWFCSQALPEGMKGGGAGIGAGIGGLLATCIMGLLPENRRKKEEDKLKHEIEMTKLRKELENVKNGKKDDQKKEELEKSDKENEAILNEGMSDPKVFASIVKSCDAIKDPVEKETMTQRFNMIRCAQYDKDGNPRTQKDVQKWMTENIPAEDLQTIVESANKQIGNTELTPELAEELKNSIPEATDEDIQAEKEKATKISAEMGVQLEADATKRKEMKAEIERLGQEKEAKQAELDKSIADAGADEEAIKKAKLVKAEFNKNITTQIYDKKKEAAEFESKCQTAKFLDSTNPARKDRVEAAIKKVDEERKTAIDAIDKEIADAGGKAETKKDSKTEEIPGYDADGDPDGTKWVKTADKNGNETFALLDKDGNKLDASKEDFEKAKKDHEENSKSDDVSNGDDEKDGDVDTDANDADGEEVDDGNGGKKKVLKNPAQAWHKKKNKATGKTTKSYYNKKGESISQKEFHEKMQKYQATKAKMKRESVSFKEFLSNHYIAESGKQYSSLRDSILKNIHD